MARARKTKTSATLVSETLCLIVAIPLFFSSVIHFKNPYYFLSEIAAYQILSPAVAPLIAGFFPCLQMQIAVCIIVNVRREAALLLSAILFFIFACAQCYALYFGMDIDCGCFGPSMGEAVSVLSASRAFVLLFAAIAGVIIIMRDRRGVSTVCSKGGVLS